MGGLLVLEAGEATTRRIWRTLHKEHDGMLANQGFQSLLPGVRPNRDTTKYMSKLKLIRNIPDLGSECAPGGWNSSSFTSSSNCGPGSGRDCQRQFSVDDFFSGGGSSSSSSTSNSGPGSGRDCQRQFSVDDFFIRGEFGVPVPLPVPVGYTMFGLIQVQC